MKTNWNIVLAGVGLVLMSACSSEDVLCGFACQAKQLDRYVAGYFHFAGEPWVRAKEYTSGIAQVRLILEKESLFSLSEDELNVFATSIGDTITYCDCGYLLSAGVVVDRLQGVTITADEDFDAEHPAGSSLNDLFEVGMVDPYIYIQNGFRVPESDKYSGEDYHGYEGIPHQAYVFYTDSLVNVSWCDKRLLPTSIWFVALKKPSTSGTYTFSVEYSFENGVSGKVKAEPVELQVE